MSRPATRVLLLLEDGSISVDEAVQILRRLHRRPVIRATGRRVGGPARRVEILPVSLSMSWSGGAAEVI